MTCVEKLIECLKATKVMQKVLQPETDIDEDETGVQTLFFDFQRCLLKAIYGKYPQV